jgi:hypothetical protein
MTDLEILFSNYWVAFAVLFVDYIRVLMIAGFSAYVLKGVAEFLP